MDADTYYIDYSESSGAGDQYDDSSPTIPSNDGRSDARTGFDPRESRDWEHWNWLNDLNENATKYDTDERIRDSQSRKRRADAVRDAETFSSQLEMTPYQRERVVFLIDNLDTLCFGSIPAEGTVLGIISLVANEDDWKIREHPTTTVCANGDCKDVALFTKIMYDCNVSPQSIRHVRKELREEL